MFITLALLLTVSALVSGSETAFFSLSPNDVDNLRKEQSKSSAAAIKLLSHQDYLLATILIINNLVNICTVILSNAIINLTVDFGEATVAEFLVKLILVTFLLLLFGEIMPKVFAAYNAMKFTRFVSLPLLFLKSLLKPFSYILISSSSRMNEALARKKVNISIDELSDAIEITDSQSAEEKKILSGIVNFVNTEVVEIMRPRVDVVAIEDDDDIDFIYKTVIESGYSRIPVYHEDMDNITGILYVKDLLPFVAQDKSFDWHTLCRKPYFVPEHKKINDLLVEFQNNKIHIAIVVDEYGSTQGVVSLEDILEEVVGDISDESDVDQKSYIKLDNNTYVFEGKTHINDLLKVVGLDDDYLDDLSGDAETVAGLMLEIKGDFLRRGEKVECHKLTLVVDSDKGHRIDKVKVIIGQ